MKSLWDTKYPMFSHLSDRNLRERAVFVQTKRNSTMADENSSASGCAIVVTTNKNQDGDHNISNESLREDNPPSFMSGVNIDELKQSFIKNFENTYCKELNERQYVTKVNGFIKEELLTTMKNIITDFIKHRTTPLLFWEINCIHYTAAITSLEYNGKLKECVKRCKNRKRKRGLFKLKTTFCNQP